MKTTVQFGNIGEDIATKFLCEQGYRIHDRNWRQGHKELDIVAEYEGILVFVEVKTRAKKANLAPEAVLPLRKQKYLIECAVGYTTEKNMWDYPSQFDLLCVCKTGSSETIEHWRNIIDVRNIMGNSYPAW